MSGKPSPLPHEWEKAKACGIFWMFNGLSLVFKVTRVEPEYSSETLDSWIAKESTTKKGGTLDLEKTLTAPLIVLSRDSLVPLCCCCSYSALARCLSARHKQTYKPRTDVSWNMDAWDVPCWESHIWMVCFDVKASYSKTGGSSRRRILIWGIIMAACQPGF